MAEDYCDLCDLPLSQCVHGMPKLPAAAEPVPRTNSPSRGVTRSAPAVRTTSTSGAAKAATARAPRVSAGASATARRAPAPSLVTAQEVFRPHIVRILKQEGPLETEDVYLELEMAMEEVLRDRDRQEAPTGEVRWHATARAERKAMIDAGLMVEGRPGVWDLTTAGRAVAY